MYVAEQHAMPASEALAHATRRGVGDFITNGPRGLDATMLPFVWLPGEGEYGVLTTHLARTNLQWQDEGPGLVIVHGPDAYISPGVVPVPAGEQRLVVPTWNYLVVHLSGELVVHHDDDWKLQSLRDLVARHEPHWRMEHQPEGAIERLLPAIVGLEFRITAVTGKAKLSQNRSTSDVISMADVLAASGHGAATGELMRQLALPYIAGREARVEQARATRSGQLRLGRQAAPR